MPVAVLDIGILNYYVCANLLLVAAACALAGIRAFNGGLSRPLTYRHALSLGRTLAVAALLLPLFAIWGGAGQLSPLRAQVWSAPSMHAGTTAISHAARIELGFDSQLASLPLDATTGVILLFFGAGLLLGLLPLVFEARATYRAIRGAYVLRHIGRIRVLISEKEPVPFAVWIPGHFFIVLPAALLLRPADVRLALRHEGQHHRQRDTRYLYAVLVGRAFFGLNPAARWLMRQLLELQEFACDEALARRTNHCVRSYCALLLRVAEAALPASRIGLRAFMASHRSFALARRIEAALQRPAHPLRAPAAIGITFVSVALLATLSASVTTPIQDRRLSLTDAEQLAATARISSAFPLTVNDAVLVQLNLLLGTPDGRAFLRGGIARMRNHESSILSELHRHGLPPELLAVPLVESGYRNLSAKSSEYSGAGLWMFIAPTARHYGLHVSTKHDERLHVPKETGAAMHMFSDLWRRFGDWPLTLMAYNTGASRVEAGISATHSHNAWALYQKGYGNEPDYLARMVAVILILANPGLLR